MTKSVIGSPGPGAYNSNYRASVKSSPGWKIGTSTRDEQERIASRTRNYPPPTTYDPNATAAQNSPAAWGFGTSQRKGMVANGKNPGPGNYELP